ncbi:hypothetical protein ACWDRR_26065 [Kitasatospora sp. NPDC003701]
MTDTGIDNPSALSDFDFMELVAFDSKVDREGFSYAYENYPPRFESPELQEVAKDLTSMRSFYGDHDHLVDQWWETVGGRGCDLHNAHIDEVQQHEDDLCLWGVLYEDGQSVLLTTEEQRENWLEYMRRNNPGRPVAALLHRSEAGGEWTKSPLAAAP